MHIEYDHLHGKNPSSRGGGGERGGYFVNKLTNARHLRPFSCMPTDKPPGTHAISGTCREYPTRAAWKCLTERSWLVLWVLPSRCAMIFLKPEERILHPEIRITSSGFHRTPPGPCQDIRPRAAHWFGVPCFKFHRKDAAPRPLSGARCRPRRATVRYRKRREARSACCSPGLGADARRPWCPRPGAARCRCR